MPNDPVTPLYIINILLSDLTHICSMIAMVTSDDFYVDNIFKFIHSVSVIANIGFMMCVALERYISVSDCTTIKLNWVTEIQSLEKRIHPLEVLS